jgi:hypothetical protein
MNTWRILRFFIDVINEDSPGNWPQCSFELLGGLKYVHLRMVDGTSIVSHEFLDPLLDT